MRVGLPAAQGMIDPRLRVLDAPAPPTLYPPPVQTPLDRAMSTAKRVMTRLGVNTANRGDPNQSSLLDDPTGYLKERLGVRGPIGQQAGAPTLGNPALGAPKLPLNPLRPPI